MRTRFAHRPLAKHNDKLAITAAARLASSQFGTGIALELTGWLQELLGWIRPWTNRSFPMTAGARTNG